MREATGPVRRVVWSTLALGAVLTLVVALAGQGLAVATFVGSLPAADARGATSWYVVLTIPWCVVVGIDQARRQGRWPQPPIQLAVAVRDHPLRTLAGLYWGLAFVGLALLGGLSNKGLTVHHGQAYVIHAHGILTPISRVAYHHQAAYPLWMFSAATFFSAALVLGVALPRGVGTARRIARLAQRYV